MLKKLGLKDRRQRTAMAHIDKAHEGLHLHQSTVEGARGQACLHNLHPQLVVEVPKAQHLRQGCCAQDQAARCYGEMPLMKSGPSFAASPISARGCYPHPERCCHQRDAPVVPFTGERQNPAPDVHDFLRLNQVEL